MSREKRERDGGWRRRMPWIRSSVDIMRRSFWPSERSLLKYIPESWVGGRHTAPFSEQALKARY